MEKRKFDEKVEELRNMSQKEFEAYIEPLRSEIRSFSGMFPPGDAVQIGHITRGNEIYFYYLDSEFNFYYESGSGYAFKRWLEKRLVSD